MFFLRLAHQLRECGRIENAVDREVDSLPEVGENGNPRRGEDAICSSCRPSTKRSTSPTVIDFGTPGEQISAFGATARFDEPALFQAGQNQLQELLRNLLPAGNIGNLYGFASGCWPRDRK